MILVNTFYKTQQILLVKVKSVDTLVLLCSYIPSFPLDSKLEYTHLLNLEIEEATSDTLFKNKIAI